MTHAYEDEELPLPLLRRVSRPAPQVDEDEAEDDILMRRDYRALRGDRLQPGAAGALMGMLAGAGALGVVNALHPTIIGNGIARLGTAWAIPPDATTPLAYVAAGLGGAVVGAIFASITRHLRRSFLALFVWAVVFFEALTMLLLAASSAYGRGFGVSLAPSILMASAAYAFIVSFELPLRRRG
jgi:hypothetical protein